MTVKKAIYILIPLVIVAVIVLSFIAGGEQQPEYKTAVIERGQLIQTVSETGTVKAAREIELNFINTGNVAKILVNIGDKVKKDQVLAELDYSGLLIKKQESEASLAIAKSELAKLLAGATAQELAVSQASVNQSLSAYEAAQREYLKIKQTEDESLAQASKELSDLINKTSNDITTYEQAVTTAQTNLSNVKKNYQRAIDNYKDSAITTSEAKLAVANTALDEVNSVLEDDDLRYILSSQNTQYKNLTQGTHEQAEDLNDIAYTSLSLAKADKSNTGIQQLLSDTEAALNKTLDSTNYCYNALEHTLTTSNFTQTELDAYKTAISAQITNVTTGISSVQTSKQNLDDAILDYETNVASAEDSLKAAQASLNNAILTAENTLATAKVSGEQKIEVAQSKVNSTREAWEVAQAQFNQVKAPARSQDIALTQANVAKAEAAVNSAQYQIDNSIIQASIDGTITKVDYEVGEQVSAAKSAIAMLGENNFEIEVDISEADIAKVNIKNPVVVTLDAFGDDVELNGLIYFIEPAETVIQDVIYYKVKIQFANLGGPKADSVNIKSGMTANIIITTAQKDKVLLIPSRAIIERNGAGKVTRILAGGKVQEAPISVGLRGDEGMTELLSGANEGDVVVTSVNEKK